MSHAESTMHEMGRRVSTPDVVLRVHRNKLRPEVRNYADNLRDQVREIFRTHHVKTVDEFSAAARAKKISIETVAKTRALLAALRTAVETNALPEREHITHRLLVDAEKIAAAMPDDDAALRCDAFRAVASASMRLGQYPESAFREAGLSILRIDPKNALARCEAYARLAVTASTVARDPSVFLTDARRELKGAGGLLQHADGLLAMAEAEVEIGRDVSKNIHSIGNALESSPRRGRAARIAERYAALAIIETHAHRNAAHSLDLASDAAWEGKRESGDISGLRKLAIAQAIAGYYDGARDTLAPLGSRDVELLTRVAIAEGALDNARTLVDEMNIRDAERNGRTSVCASALALAEFRAGGDPDFSLQRAQREARHALRLDLQCIAHATCARVEGLMGKDGKESLDEARALAELLEFENLSPSIRIRVLSAIGAAEAACGSDPTETFARVAQVLAVWHERESPAPWTVRLVKDMVTAAVTMKKGGGFVTPRMILEDNEKR